MYIEGSLFIHNRNILPQAGIIKPIDILLNLMYNISMKIIFYTIKWQQSYHNWEPFELPIIDFTEAMAVINMIKEKR